MSSNISFGNIFRINAPIKTADEIVCKLRTDEKFKDKLCKTLNLNERRIFPFNTFPDGEDKSYIFTGKESERFFKSLSMALDERDFAKSYFKKRSDLGEIATKKAMEQHGKRTENIINSCRDNIRELNIERWVNGGIKSIELIG